MHSQWGLGHPLAIYSSILKRCNRRMDSFGSRKNVHSTNTSVQITVLRQHIEIMLFWLTTARLNLVQHKPASAVWSLPVSASHSGRRSTPGMSSGDFQLFFFPLTLWAKCRCIHYPVITLLLVFWYIIHYMHSPHSAVTGKVKWTRAVDRINHSNLHSAH